MRNTGNDMMIKLRENLHTKAPTRQARLNGWLAEHELSKAQVARDLGVSPQMVSMILSGERMSKARHEQLTAYGIPAELLPEPRKPKQPGRKRCADCPHKPGDAA